MNMSSDSNLYKEFPIEFFQPNSQSPPTLSLNVPTPNYSGPNFGSLSDDELVRLQIADQIMQSSFLTGQENDESKAKKMKLELNYDENGSVEGVDSDISSYSNILASIFDDEDVFVTEKDSKVCREEDSPNSASFEPITHFKQESENVIDFSSSLPSPPEEDIFGTDDDDMPSWFTSQATLTSKSLQSIAWVSGIWNKYIENASEADTLLASCKFENLFREFLELSPKYLAEFTEKCRRPDGQPYPSRNLYSIFSIMQMYINNQKIGVNIFKDEKFYEFQSVLKEKIKWVGRVTPNKNPLSGKIPDKLEQELWAKGVLGVENPMKLLRTVFFIIKKYFFIGSRQEHRNLRGGANSQLKITGFGPSERLEYTCDPETQKLKKPHDKPHSSKPCIYKTGGPNCPVEVIKLYFSKLPPNPVAFYLKPKLDYGSESWFYNLAIGVNTFSKITDSIARDAGLDVNKTWLGSYVCSICQRSFRFQCNLSYHMKFHFLDKPHKCNLCMKCFSSKTLLWNHKKEIHHRDVRSTGPSKLWSVANKNRPPLNVSDPQPLNLSIKDAVYPETPRHASNASTRTSTKLECFKCGKETEGYEQMVTHLQMHVIELEQKLCAQQQNNNNNLQQQQHSQTQLKSSNWSASSIANTNTLNLIQIPSKPMPTITPSVPNSVASALSSSISGCESLAAIFGSPVQLNSTPVQPPAPIPTREVKPQIPSIKCPVFCQCGPCHETFNSETDLREHIRAHKLSEDSSRCGNCEMSISKNGEVSPRLSLTSSSNSAPSMVVRPSYIPTVTTPNTSPIANDDVKKFLKCNRCNLIFADKFSADKHKREHNRELRPKVDPAAVNGIDFLCTPCNIPFRTQKDLDIHKKWHESGEPLQCAFCGVILSSRLSLKRHHIHVHVTVKPHPCNICQGSFERSSHLSKHRREAHGVLH